MGAWGYGPFDNDDAADFVYAFEEEGDDAVNNALAAAAGKTGYLEAPEASVAIAAAALVAAAAGRGSWLSEPAREVFSARSGDLLRFKDKARAAISRILMPESELLQLWEEAEPADLAGFKQTLAGLRSDIG